MYSDDITLVHQFLWRVEELCQDNKLEIVDPGTKEHLWRVLLTIRGLYEIQIPPGWKTCGIGTGELYLDSQQKV